jgi:transcription elongation GreA/GreB family factor
MQKSAVRDAIVAQLQRELDLQSRAAHDSREEATSVENKAEGKYDMRSQEAAYLAEGQARLALDLAEAIALYHAINVDPVPTGSAAAVGSLITLESRGRHALYFLGPRNGGLEVQVGDELITVVTPTSPLGRQLVGRDLGASVTLPGRGAPVKHTIIAIC